MDQFTDAADDATNIVLAAIEKVATVDASGNLVIDKDKLIDCRPRDQATTVRPATSSSTTGR